MGTYEVELTTGGAEYRVYVSANDATEAEWCAINEVQNDEPDSDPKVIKASHKGVNLKRK